MQVSQVQGTAASRPRGADRRLLLVAIALGAIAAGLTLAYLRSLENRLQYPVPTSSVVVARQEIAAGMRITAPMVELRNLPVAVTAEEAATSIEQVVGQTLRYPVARGEQIASVRLVSPARAPTISFQIPLGLRGFTIPVQMNRSPAALLAPGDFVDVLAVLDSSDLGVAPPPNLDPRQAREYRGAATVLQNVQVLAVQRQFVENGVPYDASVRGVPSRDTNIGYLTLAVSPEEAQFLTLVLDQARLMTVSLRGFGDTDTKVLPPSIQLTDLNLGRGNPAVTAPR